MRTVLRNKAGEQKERKVIKETKWKQETKLKMRTTQNHVIFVPCYHYMALPRVRMEETASRYGGRCEYTEWAVTDIRKGM